MQPLIKLLELYLKIIEKNENVQEAAEVALEQEYSGRWFKDFCNSSYLLEELSKITSIVPTLLEKIKRAEEHKEYTKVVYSDYSIPQEMCNNRVCIIKSNGVFHALYWNSTLDIPNSHSAIMQELEKGLEGHVEARWCGFYSANYGNGDNILTFYGESFDYRHNQEGWEVLYQYIKQLCKRSPFDDVIVIKRGCTEAQRFKCN